MTNPASTPVIVGIGESIDRECVLEPRVLAVDAARSAATGLQSIMAKVDRLDVISIMSWPYLDIARAIAGDLGIDPVQAHESVAGGEKPIRLLGEAAADITNGEARAVLICGAEAMRTRGQLAKTGQIPDWGPTDPNAKVLSSRDFVTAHAARYGLLQPTQVYPLYENATRRAWGQTVAQAQAESATLWSRYSGAAAVNPYAWLNHAFSVEQIVEDTLDNRMISYPYRKLMVANPMVNQGAAILVTSLAEARAAGIDEDRMVYIGAAARANEPADFLKRARYDRSTAQNAVLRATVEMNDLHADEIDLFELYSCFPTVPKMARRCLELGDDIQPSVTGGLTFFGGPANNYMTHAIAAASRALMYGTGRNVLLYGQGEFVTKHAAIILQTSPFATVKGVHDVQAEVDEAGEYIPTLLERYEGPAVIESFTVTYDRHGRPEVAPIICRTPTGERTVALGYGDNARLIALLTSTTDEPIGTSGHISIGGDERLSFSL